MYCEPVSQWSRTTLRACIVSVSDALCRSCFEQSVEEVELEVQMEAGLGGVNDVVTAGVR